MSGNINSVFYAKTYHPIQAGSIDGTDILPHDNAVYRALLCSQAGLCSQGSHGVTFLLMFTTRIGAGKYICGLSDVSQYIILYTCGLRDVRSTKIVFLISLYICYLLSFLQVGQTLHVYKCVSGGLSDGRYYMERRELSVCGPSGVSPYIMFVLFLLLFDIQQVLLLYILLDLVQVLLIKTRWRCCGCNLNQSGRCSSAIPSLAVHGFCHGSWILYDPFGDPKLIGDPYCTIFVGHLSHLTTEQTLRKAMSKYGKVKNLRLVRHIVTGASCGYAFVEFETEREMRHAYEDAHHSLIDDSEILVDYNRQQLMPGWIPRRLGGGLGGKKESGQLRFGGRERPFRAPLRPIPWDDLKKLGIPPPPEGRYMSRFQVASPPRRKRSYVDKDEQTHRRHKHSKHSGRHERRSASRDPTSDD